MKKKLLKKIMFISILGIIIFVVILSFIFKNRYFLRSPLIVMKDAKITFVLGKVLYKNDESKKWLKAKVGTTLQTNSEIKTLEKSKVDIKFNQKSVIRLNADSYFKLNEYNINQQQLYIKKGEIIGRFKKLFDEQKISIQTPTTNVGVRGTEIQIKTNNDQTEIFVLSGILEISNNLFPKNKILLSHQKKSIIYENSPPSNPIKMKQKQINKIRQTLNAIHEEPVLIISDKILFEFNSAKLLAASYPELNYIVKLIKQLKVKIRIEGHTDNIGTSYINQQLSILRANRVKKYLIKKGIKEKNVFIKGYGDSKPISDNQTKEGRSQNRRVEFIIPE